MIINFLILTADMSILGLQHLRKHQIVCSMLYCIALISPLKRKLGNSKIALCNNTLTYSNNSTLKRPQRRGKAIVFHTVLHSRCAFAMVQNNFGSIVPSLSPNTMWLCRKLLKNVATQKAIQSFYSCYCLAIATSVMHSFFPPWATGMQSTFQNQCTCDTLCRIVH